MGFLETFLVIKNKQRTGIGRKLIEYIIKKGKRNNIKKIVVGSFIKYRAKDFYLKCGFKLLPQKGKLGRYSYYNFEYIY